MFVLQVYYQGEVVKQVDVSGMSGSFGIVAQHVPTVAALKSGLLTVIENDGKAKNFFGNSSHYYCINCINLYLKNLYL